ncbi:hypothetical protein Tco_0897276 [Tanacetum coccineum]
MDQLKLDEELCLSSYIDKEKEKGKREEKVLPKEKAQQREEEANMISWHNVQAMIDADYQMAQQMKVEEQEKLSIEEKSKLFVQLLEARKKYFAAIRAKEKRNKPPIYFDDIQKLFDKAMKRVNTFVDMDTELVEGSKEGAKTEIAQESSSKRASTKLEQESFKKKKVDEQQSFKD